MELHILNNKVNTTKNHQGLFAPTSPFRMMMRMAAMLSLSGEMILQFSTMLLMILLGLSSASSLLYLSAMKSV